MERLSIYYSFVSVKNLIHRWVDMKRHSGERRAGELLGLAARSVGAKHAEKAYKLQLLQQLLAEIFEFLQSSGATRPPGSSHLRDHLDSLP